MLVPWPVAEAHPQWAGDQRVLATQVNARATPQQACDVSDLSIDQGGRYKSDTRILRIVKSTACPVLPARYLL